MRVSLSLTAPGNSHPTHVTGDIDFTADEMRTIGLLLLAGAIQGRPTLTANDTLSRANELITRIIPGVKGA